MKTMTISRSSLLAALLLAAACGTRSAETPPAAADSTAIKAEATADSGATAGLMRDSLVRDSVVRDSVATAIAKRPSAVRGDSGRAAGTKAQSPYLGRDSAYGPKFTLDSTGKVVPIEKKKP